MDSGGSSVELICRQVEISLVLYSSTAAVFGTKETRTQLFVLLFSSMVASHSAKMEFHDHLLRSPYRWFL